jgi:hypothetical protein
LPSDSLVVFFVARVNGSRAGHPAFSKRDNRGLCASGAFKSPFGRHDYKRRPSGNLGAFFISFGRPAAAGTILSAAATISVFELPEIFIPHRVKLKQGSAKDGER